MKKKIESTRVDIRIPNPLLEKIEQYQKDEDFQDRTKAMLDLVKKGLNTYYK